MRVALLTAAGLVAVGVGVSQGNVGWSSAGGNGAALAYEDQAQGRGQARGRGQVTAATRQRFREMDQNGDGIISRAEWRGSTQSFRVHDWNNDGVLSAAELQEAGRQGQSAEPRDYDGLDVVDDWSASRFSTLDRNRDGRVTRAEWIDDLDTFRRVDRNRDNVLSRAEFLGGDFDDDRGDRFDFLDEDGNNRVTRQEWHGSAQAFAWLDANRDGVLTREEVEGDEGVEQADQFARLDGNRDSRISRTEWRWSRASFDRLDVNGDDVLTRRELAASVTAGESTSATSDSATVSVGGTTRWVDTGIFLYSGDTVRFQASGTVQMSGDPSDIADPAGARSNRLAASAPLPTRPAGGLLARVGETGPMFIGGTATDIRVMRTGRLYLSVNDDHLDDNRGEFRVVIAVRRGQ